MLGEVLAQQLALLCLLSLAFFWSIRTGVFHSSTLINYFQDAVDCLHSWNCFIHTLKNKVFHSTASCWKCKCWNSPLAADGKVIGASQMWSAKANPTPQSNEERMAGTSACSPGNYLSSQLQRSSKAGITPQDSPKPKLGTDVELN